MAEEDSSRMFLFFLSFFFKFNFWLYPLRPQEQSPRARSQRLEIVQSEGHFQPKMGDESFQCYLEERAEGPQFPDMIRSMETLAVLSSHRNKGVRILTASVV